MLEVEPSSEAVAAHTCCANWSWSDGFQFMPRSDQRHSWAGDGILSLIHLGNFILMRIRNGWKLSLTQVLIETSVC